MPGTRVDNRYSVPIVTTKKNATRRICAGMAFFAELAVLTGLGSSSLKLDAMLGNEGTPPIKNFPVGENPRQFDPSPPDLQKRAAASLQLDFIFQSRWDWSDLRTFVQRTANNPNDRAFTSRMYRHMPCVKMTTVMRLERSAGVMAVMFTDQVSSKNYANLCGQRAPPWCAF